MSSDVEFSVTGGIGRITLNRPKARNALTTGMVIAIKEQLDAWDLDPAVRAAVVVGAGDHGLCAGGDVRDMQASAIRGDDGAAEFFRAEYRMNARIHQFSKPYISIMDGLAMGGGIGVSAHGSVRVITVRSLLAMPEVTIGICVDVGATWLLSRAQGEVGTYLALTGSTFGPGDAIYCGFADYFIPVADLAKFLQGMEIDATAESDDGADAENESVESLLAEFSQDPPESRLEGARGWIDDCFSFDSVAEILNALDEYPLPEANETAALIRSKSPSAVAVTLEALRRARATDSLEQALETEFAVSCFIMYQHDAIEGIRALIVDKDRNPQWHPPTNAGVTRAYIEAAFEPSMYGTLGLLA
jgi:enoyl-CoA hydratase